MMLLIVLVTFQVADAQEFRFKKEIEFSPIVQFSKSSSGSFYNAGGIATFRYFVLPRLAVYGQFGAGISDLKYSDVRLNGFSYTYGAGVNYFFKPNQSGFYLNGGIGLGRIQTNNLQMDDTWYGKAGLGYRFKLSDRTYLSLEQNVRFNMGERRAFLEPRIGIGIKF